MKRLVTLLLLFLPLMITAQEIGIEELTEQHVKGDLMKGTQDRMVWASQHVMIEDGRFSPIIYLKHGGHVFTGGSTMIGFYNNQDSLVGKATILPNAKPTTDRQHFVIQGAIFATDSIPNAEYSKDKFVIKNAWRLRLRDAIGWVQANDGNMRIVTSVYGERTYDIRLKFKKAE